MSGMTFASQQAFEKWLKAHHADSDGVWLQIAKKGTGIETVSYMEAIDVALCYGWIDGQKRPLDDEYWLQRFTARRPKSKWSQVNRDKATALIAGKKMKPAGLLQIEEAKADGRWDAAYPSPRTAEVPEDLAAALAKNKKAGAFFATLNGANRYAILYRLHHAKKNRDRKIADFVAMLAQGETFHP